MKNTIIRISIGVMLLSQSILFAQKKDYIIKQENDTVYVDNLKLKDGVVKFKRNSKNSKYEYKEVKGFYKSKKEKHYVKVKLPITGVEGGVISFLERIT